MKLIYFLELSLFLFKSKFIILILCTRISYDLVLRAIIIWLRINLHIMVKHILPACWLVCGSIWHCDLLSGGGRESGGCGGYAVCVCIYMCICMCACIYMWYSFWAGVFQFRIKIWPGWVLQATASCLLCIWSSGGLWLMVYRIK